MSQLGGTTTAGDAARALALAAGETAPDRRARGRAIRGGARPVGGRRPRDLVRRRPDRPVRPPARAERRRGRRGDRALAHPHRRHERCQVPGREAGLRRLPPGRLQRRPRRGHGAHRAANACSPRAAHVRDPGRHGGAARDRRRARPAADRGLRARARRDLARAARRRDRHRRVLQHRGDEDHLDDDGRRRRHERRDAGRTVARVPARVPTAGAVPDCAAAGQAGGVLRAHRAPRPHRSRGRPTRRSASASRCPCRLPTRS